MTGSMQQTARQTVDWSSKKDVQIPTNRPDRHVRIPSSAFLSAFRPEPHFHYRYYHSSETHGRGWFRLAEESCLSLEGARPTTRYETIEVKYLDANFKEKTQVFNGFVAQIIQHEMDHFEGIII